jgi:hypothetical protein
MRALLVVAVCLSSALALAGDLTVEDIAKLKAEQTKARDAVAKKYGDKPSGEQRRAMVKEQNEAAQAVLDKAGVDEKAYVRAVARANGNDVDQVMKAMEKADEAKKKAAAKTGGAGTSGDTSAGGTAGDQAADDAAAAAEMDKQMGLKGGKKK